jgi:hypothetical protein
VLFDVVAANSFRHWHEPPHFSAAATGRMGDILQLCRV